MAEALRQHLPEYVRWNEPRGGFYIWLTLPAGADATAILKHAIEGGAVFVTGNTFDPEGTRNDTMRLSYCNNTPEEIERGIPIIARAIREVCGQVTPGDEIASAAICQPVSQNSGYLSF
jgi:DNA-binding transcriptional MocR family regulator